MYKEISDNLKNIPLRTAEEKHRRPIYFLQEKYWFPIEDFINLTVYSNHLQKEIKLKTFLRLPDKNKHPEFKGLVYMFHGFGAHSNQLAQVAYDFADEGFIVASYTCRAHYQSEGETIKDFQEVIDDTQQFIKQTDQYIKEKYGEKTSSNKFMWGGSMGALICFEVTKNSNDCKGVLFLAPPFGFTQDLGSLPEEEREKLVSKNPEFYDQKNKYPKSCDNTESKIALCLQIQKSIIELHTYNTPFQLSIAGIDKLIPPLSQYALYEKAKTEDKEVHFYPDGWHGMIFEEEYSKIIKTNLDWIHNKLK